MGEMSSCMRCGREVAARRLKEVVYEEGGRRARRKLMVCASCLDRLMNEAGRVRGVAGTEKHAAVHIDPGPGDGQRVSLGARGASC